MNKTLITSIVTAAGLAVSGLSLAAAPTLATTPVPAPSLWYVGVGLNYNAIQKDSHTCNEQSPFKLTSKDIGVNFLAGKRINNWFSNEAGISQIGDATWTQKGEEGSKDKFSIKDIWHIYYDGYVSIPLNQSFEVFAKGGLSYLEAKNQRKEAEGSEVYDAYHSTLRTFAMNYGCGVQFNWQQAAVRGQYTRVVPNHDSDDFHGITDTVNLDVLWYYTITKNAGNPGVFFISFIIFFSAFVIPQFDCIPENRRLLRRASTPPRKDDWILAFARMTRLYKMIPGYAR